MPPAVRYARNGDVSIAYQVVGEGPHDVLMVPGWISHLALDWVSADRLPPYGLQMWWPFNDGWFISGWDLFQPTERHDFFSAASIRTNVLAVMQEVAFLAPPLVLLWLVRVKALAGLPSEVSRGNHAAK